MAKSLYNRACGYSHKEVVLHQYQGDIIQTEVTKQYPPDTAAAFIWLKNRRGANWRDKHEVEHSGKLSLAELVAESVKPAE